MKSICVVGLGYIGIPTTVMFANHGVKVPGVDLNPTAVKSIQEKKLHIEENGLQIRLNKAVDDCFNCIYNATRGGCVYFKGTITD